MACAVGELKMEVAWSSSGGPDPKQGPVWPRVRDRQAETEALPQFVLHCARAATRGSAALTHAGTGPAGHGRRL